MNGSAKPLLGGLDPALAHQKLPTSPAPTFSPTLRGATSRSGRVRYCASGRVIPGLRRYQLKSARTSAPATSASFLVRERWIEAAEKGLADPFIRELPAGYDTQLGKWFKDGRELSGGQWQKVALSRAFMRTGADVLVLDEPTAAMDAGAEAEVFEHFRALTRGRITILISHRFSTVRMADQIVVARGGRIVERGSHAELMQVDGRYARLFTLQARDTAEGLAPGYNRAHPAGRMKLHRLRYLAAVVQNGLNITTAARKLHTSQPGVSKQLKLLEDELGFPLFEREGRNLTRVTAAGQEVVDRALRILEEAQNIRRLSSDLKDERSGSLVDRNDPHAGALRAAERRAALPWRLSGRRPAPAPGTSGADCRARQARPHSTSRSRPVATSFFPAGAAAVLPLEPQGHRAARASARDRTRAQPQGARALPACHLYVFLRRPLVAAALFESAGPQAQGRADRKRRRRHQDLRAPRARVGIVASMALDPEEDRDLAVLDASNLFART